MIQTVLGEIKKEELGITSSHEHVNCDLTPFVDDDANNPYLDLDFTADRRYLVNEDPYLIRKNGLLNIKDAYNDLSVFKKFGGKTIVECTTADFGRNAKDLYELSKATGVNIIMGCGHYLGASLSEEVRKKSVDELAKEIIDDINIGVDGTGIKAGFIGEVGTCADITELEWKNVRASAIASNQTGAGIHFHTALWSRHASAIIKEATALGAKPNKICIDHIDVDLRYDYLLEILNQGAFVEFDNIGKEFYVPKTSKGPLNDRFAYDLERAKVIGKLVKDGFAKQILLANDICLQSMLINYGGNGYAHLLRHFVAMLVDQGISQKDIDNMLIYNPAEFLDM